VPPLIGILLEDIVDKIEICNLAIGWVGGNAIMSFDDDAVEAELCSQAYGPTRDWCLEQRDWTFAATRAILGPLAAVPAFEYTAAFQLPTELLVVRQVSDGPDMRAIDYTKEQKTILANAAELYIKYTVQVLNENLFSPSFTYALAHKIAAVIANPLTQDKAMKKEMEALAQSYIELGGSVDGTQTKVGRAYASKIVGARTAGLRGSFGWRW
jgi:hypothetical protein